MSMYAASLRDHNNNAKRNKGEWRHRYAVLGISVCQVAFCNITGIGRSTLNLARQKAHAGHKSWLSKNELPLHLAISPSQDPVVYLDARSWIEVYADTHDNNPQKDQKILHAGRKSFYYRQYVYDRKQQNLPDESIASESTFLKAWRT